MGKPVRCRGWVGVKVASGKQAMESVEGSSFHDAGPTITKEDRGKKGASVLGEERAGVQQVPGGIAPTVQ